MMQSYTFVFNQIVPVLILIILVAFINVNGVNFEHSDSKNTHDEILDDSGFCNDGQQLDNTQQVVSLSSPRDYKIPGCRIYLAKSTVMSPSAGMGVFAAVPLKRGQVIAPPDIALQLYDFPADMQGPLNILIQNYAWESHITGGFNEGKRVASILPGIGSLSNAQTIRSQANAIPFRPDCDEANVGRSSKEAGAFSHYHNFTFHAYKDLDPGAEIFVHYPSNEDLYQDRIKRLSIDNNKLSQDNVKHMRDVSWLESNGHCLDNLKPGQSTVKGAGRGAFATRFIPEGTLISPSPVVQITNHDALNIKKKKENGVLGTTPQLLLNYCFGSTNSSLLFLPISSTVNFINHGTADQINAKVQWSSSTQHRGRNWPLYFDIKQMQSLKSTGLMFDYIATKDIFPNEEIFIDYGLEWSQAWEEHGKTWKSSTEDEDHTPAYVMEDVAGVLRTDKEQITHPYPENLITSCFHIYSASKEGKAASGEAASKAEVTTVRWKMERGTFDFKNLRPCSIIQRDELPNKQFLYSVMIKNRHALSQDARIPKGQMHVVKYVPRHAIRFTDKIYTTDMHLRGAFRHAIGMPVDMFPKQWEDERFE